MNTKAKGDVSEAMVTAALLQRGEVILVPFGDNQRYDLVIDRADTFLRVQVKSGRLRDGAILFNTRSNHYHRGKGYRSYEGQIEFFGVYCPETGTCYLVPIDACGGLQVGSLRVEATKNGQKTGIRWASEFRI